jgi:hypothetical protein
LVAVCGVCGCPAKPELPPGPDLSEPPPDMVMMMEPPPPDLATGPDMSMCAQGPEICDNQCDDDRNGYSDGNDPACTGGQVLVTLALSAPTTAPLYRWLFWPVPSLVVLDGNPTGAGAMATFNRKFSPWAYIGADGNSKVLRRLTLDGGLYETPNVGFQIRDVCIFNGELIVVEPIADMAPGGRLHRFKADATTEIMPPVSVDGTLSACASDGTNLYVSRYSALDPSQIVVITQAEFAKRDTSTSAVIEFPAGVAQTGCSTCDRLIDFAYVPASGLFVALFADGNLGSLPDNQLDSELVTMFALDGGIGPPIDFGSYHGVGEFIP